jgi:hypothetical protein
MQKHFLFLATIITQEVMSGKQSSICTHYMTKMMTRKALKLL